MHADGLGLDVRPHHPGKRTFVGNRQAGIAKLVRPLDQLLGVRSTAQKAEVGNAMQFSVVGQ